jgi:hypothetical protein
MLVDHVHDLGERANPTVRDLDDDPVLGEHEPRRNASSMEHFVAAATEKRSEQSELSLFIIPECKQTSKVQ